MVEFFLDEQGEDFPAAQFTSKYWPIAFELFFSDSLLIGMFGREADVQALRLCIERLMPKAQREPILVELPDEIDVHNVCEIKKDI